LTQPLLLPTATVRTNASTSSFGSDGIQLFPSL